MRPGRAWSDRRADRMLTCWSDSTRVTSESSRVRSSASTWICDEEHDCWRGRPLDLDEPLGLLRAATRRWCSRARCTETPLPRVTKPMIGSPGTGVQHLASLTQTSATPLTTTPGSPLAGRRARLVRVGVVASARSSAGALLAAERLRPAGCTTVCAADVALADRGVERGDVGVAQLARRRSISASPVISRCSGRPCLRIALAIASLPLLDRLLAALLGEPLPDLVAGPRRLDEASASRGWARRRRPWR